MLAGKITLHLPGRANSIYKHASLIFTAAKLGGTFKRINKKSMNAEKLDGLPIPKSL